MKNHYSTLAVLLLGGIAFYLLNYFCPLRKDDYMYMFPFLDRFVGGVVAAVDTEHPISTLSDVAVSQYNHYWFVNGRIPAHFLVQSFIGVWGKAVYNVCAALVFMALWHGSVRLVKRQGATTADYVVIGALLWLLQPCINCLYSGIDFSVNYLFSTTLAVYFMLAFRHCLEHDGAVGAAVGCGLFAFSVLMGWMHEGYALPLSGTLFFLAVYRRGRLTPAAWLMTAGLWIGTALVVFSPGTLHRGGSTLSHFNIEEFLAVKMDMIRYSKRFYLLCAALVAGWVLKGKGEMAAFLKQNILLLTTITLSMAFVFVINHYSQRMQFFSEFLCIVIGLRLLYTLRLSAWQHHALCTVLALAMLFHIPATIYYVKAVNDEFTRMLNEYKASPDGATTYRNIYLPPTIKTRVVDMNDMEIEMFENAYHKKAVITAVP